MHVVLKFMDYLHIQVGKPWYNYYVSNKYKNGK